MSFQHPRRTQRNSALPVINTGMSLQKGATFHSPSSPETATFVPPSLPRRSQSSLEEVIVDDYVRRITLTLGEIDLGLSALQSKSSSGHLRDESVPVPRGFLTGLDAPTEPSTMAPQAPASPVSSRRMLRPRRANRTSANHDHASDSGLGSSIETTASKAKESEESTNKTSVGAHAITRSAAGAASMTGVRGFSQKGMNRVNQRILAPLLAEKKFKDLHPILLDCPRRIQQKEIVCLRDLEKTLLQVAEVSDVLGSGVFGFFAYSNLRRPKERAKTAALYYQFSMTSIRCIQATVQHFHEREQVRPSDRAYTNGYFIDLVDQVRQAAIQMAASREKQSKGEQLDDEDAESYVAHVSLFVSHPANLDRSDEIKLYGGLTANGKPAELVRVKKNGKAYSITTREPIDAADLDAATQSNPMKRSASEQDGDNDFIMRSMARRKKTAAEIEAMARRCPEPGCEHRTFPRQCDLTKHQKTHLRPYKCSDTSCSYHQKGFPTEKECERHWSNVHSADPVLFRCYFHKQGCTHTSKRESNLKQHMEKQHQWTYQRSKSNGKSKGKSTSVVPSTPSTMAKTSPESDSASAMTPAHTPEKARVAPSFEHEFPDLSPDIQFYDEYEDQPMLDTNCDMGFIPGFDSTTTLFNYSPTASLHSTPEDAILDDFSADTSFDLSNAGASDIIDQLFDPEEIYDVNRVQLPTPAIEIFKSFGQDYQPSAIPTNYSPVPQISPHGQPNAMLYTPTSLQEVDEGFQEGGSCAGFGGDFSLFGGSDDHLPTNFGTFDGTSQTQMPLLGSISDVQMGAWPHNPVHDRDCAPFEFQDEEMKGMW
jgi:hypothetical protein